jgi:hypothetical protein
MNRKMRRFLLLPVFMIAVIFTSCKNDNNSTLTKMNVKITDAPGAYDALYLNIKEIQVFTSEGQSTLEVAQNRFDILDFRMGKDTLLASKDIPSGRLQEIRLVLNETGNEVVIDGHSYPLTTPSGQTSGLKLKVQDDLIGGIAYTMTLDFDAAKSVVNTGSGKYILKPVIRAIPQAVSGGLTGVITPSASNAKVYAITGLDTIGAVADVTGKFFFPGLTEGNYKVNVVPVSPYITKSIENVSVIKGSIKDMGTIIITQ